MKILICALLAAASAFGAVDGVITNQTTGQPQPGVEINLVKLGSGMDQVGSTKSDAQGKFHFDTTLDSSVPYLLQANYSDVTYNKAIPPGMPAGGVAIDVYNSAAKVPEAAIAQHMLLLQPSETALMVNESIEFENSGKVTQNDPKTGDMRFYLPEAAKGQVGVSVSAPGGLPITRVAEKTGTPNVYKVNYPIKPGATRFDLTYAVPATKEFSGKALAGEKVRIVVPKGVTIQGEGITPLGVEPSTQAQIFEVPPKGWKVSIEGTGSLRAANDQGQGAGAADSGEDQGPGIEEAKPKIYSKLPWMLGFSGLVLIFGFALLYRADTTASQAAGVSKKK